MTWKPEAGKPATWNELANLYDEAHPGGRRARTFPMHTVWDWAERRTDKFIVKMEHIYVKD